jgi:hypothetical protein
LQEEGKEPAPVQPELSEVWRELLGTSASAPAEAIIPMLESDPWSELLRAKGVEIVDLRQVPLHISDQDMEQVLSIMQEHPVQDTQGKDNQVTDNQS